MTARTIDNDSLIDTLYEAQEHLNEAISLLETYVRQTGDNAAEAYILDHLRIFAGREHGFLSRDLNLDDLIERLNEQDDDEDEQDNVDDESGPDETPLHIRTASGHDLYWAAGRYVTVPGRDDE